MGDAACWLHETCLSCGRFLGSEAHVEDRCPHCGAELLPPANDPVATVESIPAVDTPGSPDGDESEG